jgi:prophage maintenance system killer protein
MSLLMKRTLLLKFLSLNDFPFQVNNELVDEAYAVAKLGLVKAKQQVRFMKKLVIDLKCGIIQTKEA